MNDGSITAVAMMFATPPPSPPPQAYQNPLPEKLWKKAVQGVFFVAGCAPVRLGKRPEKPTIFKTKLDKHVESCAKLAEKRAKELRKLRELDLTAWSSCQSRNTCEKGSGLADSTAHAHKLLPWLLSTDVDDEDEDDGESHSNLAPWLRNRKHMWRAAREARSAEGSTRAPAHGISD